MPLEPTQEQRAFLVAAAAMAVDDPWGNSVSADVPPLVARALWPIIRDMVLEGAAMLCDRKRDFLRSTPGYNDPNETVWRGQEIAAQALGEEIREMMGPPKP